MTRLFGYIIIISLFLSLKPEAKMNTLSVEVLGQSSLYIKGTSNIKNFNCKYAVDQMNNPISVVYEHYGSSIEFKSASLKLNTSNFYCDNRGIDKDLMTLLRSDEHPVITLQPERVIKIPGASDTYTASVLIDMVGKTKSYWVTMIVESDLCVSGMLYLDIRDFGLEPPKKVLGLIKISPFIEIHFQLKLKTC